MSLESQEPEERGYLVVVNAEEQYSIWAIDRALPRGWSAVGFRGSRAECLAYVDRVWTDMRPASLRRRTEVLSGADHLQEARDDLAPLPVRLCSGVQKVELGRSYVQGARLEDSLLLGCLHLRFPMTNGGTELLLEVEREMKPAADANGALHFTGETHVDGVRLRVEIVLDQESGEGTATITRCA